MNLTKKVTRACNLALTLSIALVPFSYAAEPINSIQDGRIIQGGTYYNTSNAKTTFVNSGSGGLWLKSDSTVRGLEVNANGGLTNHGGTVQLYAPGNVVRIDGKLDVSGVSNGNGAFIGDGGKVYVDAGYLYHNGSILANGQNGGLVQLDVGSVTLANGAQIQAQGLNGAGGVVNINSPNLVDLRINTGINTSGQTVGAFDRNVIDIEAGAIIVQGNLRADGIASAGQGARGGTIRLISSGLSDLQKMDETLKAASFNNPGDTSAPTITPQERGELMARNSDIIFNFDGGTLGGQVIPGTYTSGLISANGSGDTPSSANDPSGGGTRAGDGGSIIMSANSNIFLGGVVQANGANGGNRINPYAGGNGGTISLSAGTLYTMPGSTTSVNGGSGGSSLSATGAGAKGGDGGMMVLSYRDFWQHDGLLQANGAVGGKGSTAGQGGQGGLVIFAGGFDGSESINGMITANGAFGGNSSAIAGGLPGTVVQGLPLNPVNVRQYGFINGHFVNNPLSQFISGDDLLTHGENLISLVHVPFDSVDANFFTDTLANATIRSVYDPTGSLGTARQEVIDKNTSTSPYVFRNLIFSSTGNQYNINFQPPSLNGLVTLPTTLSNDRGFDTLNTFTVRNAGNISNSGEVNQPLNFWVMGREHNIFGGGHIAWQSPGGNFISVDDTLQTNGTANSGSILLSSGGDLRIGTSLPTLLNASGGLHGGAIQLKSPVNMLITGTDQETPIAADGRLMGGNINARLFGNYTSQLKTTLSTDTTASGIVPPGNPQAGIINIIAASTGSTVTNGQDLGVDGLISSIHANSTNGRGGYVQLASEGSLVNNIGVIEANGGLHGGVVSLTGKFPAAPFAGLPQMRIPSLTPPVTNIEGSGGTDFVGQGSVINLGAINALGKNGRIYLGGNDGVVFAEKSHDLYPDSPVPTLNGQAILPSVIFNSSDPNASLQAIGQNINKNGQQVYIVAGNELVNKDGQGQNAADIVNGEAAANHSAPNVNPFENGQGAAFTQDFEIQKSP